jgi:hypothetical protein
MARVWTWFTGIRLYVCTNSGTASFPAVSGKPVRDDMKGLLRFTYDVKSQGSKDSGPLPEGEYKFRLSDARVYEHTRTTYLKAVLVGALELSPQAGRDHLTHTNDAWGKIPDRAGRIVPILTRDGRSEYAMNRNRCWIHGSHFPGSIGCIDLTSFMDSFLATLQREVARETDDIPLKVRYGMSPEGPESREVDDQGRDISRIA